MPPKKAKRRENPQENTGRKLRILDEIGVDGAGVYCVCPYINFDKLGRSVFKVGMSTNLHSRIDTYNGYFPTLSAMIGFIYNLKLPDRRVEGFVDYKSLASYIKAIERYIFRTLNEKKDVHQIYTTGRVLLQNVDREGATEWFLCHIEDIAESFHQACEHFNIDKDTHLKMFHYDRANVLKYYKELQRKTRRPDFDAIIRFAF